jgi:diguanylate cyclase (GGDEF)-like protein
MIKLQKNFTFFSIVLVGFIAIGAFYFFYAKQKELPKQQKELLLTIDAIESSESRLEFLLLQNYIYAYNNNDAVADMLQKIHSNIEKLRTLPLLQTDEYKILKHNIDALQKEYEALFANTQQFTMLNSAIKNSLIFLATYENFFPKKNQKELFYKASKIIVSLLYVKRMNDVNYAKKSMQLPLSLATTDEEKRFIRNFNRHVAFLLRTFPILEKHHNAIKSNKLYAILQNIHTQFASIAAKDLLYLDYATLILFIIFLMTYLVLITYILKYDKEHKKLLMASQELSYAARQDKLTKLRNRFAFNQDKEKLTSPLVVLINIDRFKDINDVYGNSIGDEVLKLTAEFILEKAQLEKSFYDMYRIGGDEFCLLFDTDAIEKIYNLVQNIQTELSTKEFLIHENEISVFTTIAINNIHPLLENADLTLKYLKANKTKKLEVYSHKLNLQKEAQNNVSIIKTLRKALQEDRVIIYFQPIVSLKSNMVEKYEVLVRIIEQDRILLPFEFLDIAKKTILYQEITQVVIEKTMKTAALYPQYRFSINLSMDDIQNESLIKNLFALFEKNIAVASRIDIELLETEYLEDIQKVKNFIDRIHSFGSLVLLDDYGSGFSNFSYFSDLEIDIVKIDGSIINEIAVNKRKLHMLEAIAQFCKGMDLKNVAEFVDNAEIEKILKKLQIDYAQGYYYSKPIPKPLDSPYIFSK